MVLVEREEVLGAQGLEAATGLTQPGQDLPVGDRVAVVEAEDVVAPVVHSRAASRCGGPPTWVPGSVRGRRPHRRSSARGGGGGGPAPRGGPPRAFFWGRGRGAA